jgi:hypothetical protein
MKRIMTVVATLTLLGTSASVWAEETAGEKLDEATTNVKSTSKKVMHRTSEAACTGSRAECSKKAAKNEADEASDDAANKTKELKDKAN